MPTINQLIRKKRTKIVKRKKITRFTKMSSKKRCLLASKN